MFGSVAGTSAVPVAGAVVGAAVVFSVEVLVVSAVLSLEQLASANSAATRRVDRIFIDLICVYESTALQRLARRRRFFG